MIGKGTLVKIPRGGERIWCEVLDIAEGGRLLVEINDEPIMSGLERGQQLMINALDVIDHITEDNQ